MTIITAWSASVVVGSNSREGRDTIRPESICSRVGGIILWRTHRLEWTRNKKLSRHTALPPERAKAETERSVYLRREQVCAHRASECFDLN